MREREGDRGDGTETKEMIPKKDVSCICEVGSYWAEIGVPKGMFEEWEKLENLGGAVSLNVIVKLCCVTFTNNTDSAS